MAIFILYNRNTPAERACAALAESLERERIDSELIDADSPRGIQLAENYDVLARPVVILTAPDGSPRQVWPGQDGLPPVSDIVYMAHQ